MKSGCLTVILSFLLLLKASAWPQRLLLWDYTNDPPSNLIFEVWHSTTIINYDTNLLSAMPTNLYSISNPIPFLSASNFTNWSLLTRTTDTDMVFTMSNPYEVFIVRAAQYQITNTTDWATNIGAKK